MLDLGSAHAPICDWMFRQALPFWDGPGNEGEGGSCEHLRLDGVPALAPPGGEMVATLAEAAQLIRPTEALRGQAPESGTERVP